ncbi:MULTISPECIES: colanic acid biosynthesis acetyltransferase WcaF [Cedecea]|uniref:Colanic acid biosynthesis acetyltransferase WcaF n=1 Tax=Cedecea davisae DSM 4568 TaxID=566551 RepID=S3IRV4_9ENTR|nr:MULTISPECIES: colanic acid biosynthesis acetyltransferase WcaF [Cedecea]EPF15775.1 bacterial transferase hexapeptide repeat protein [Cedecea davisae DSM 4568]QIX97162.1 colanic acid biosynthesis acetyltransferase WcaF [Cedecea sp. FDAARGOS_727]SUX38660.1 Galactoside O-acetyltransferase [Cedecea davisae]
MQELSGFSVPRGFRGAGGIKVQLWWAVQATLFAWSPQVLYPWRAFLLRLFGAKVGKKVVIRPSVKITYPWKLTLGDHAWVGDDAVLYTLGEIVVGANSVVSQKCYLCTGSHDYMSKHFDITQAPIVIGEKCWLATDVFVSPGVTIGDGCVVGARSSVYKSLPANAICRGNPAVKIRERA